MICPNCGFEESETFCRKCGTRTDTPPLEPVTASVPSAKTSAIQVKLVCPNCEQQNIYGLTEPHVETITCVSCQTQYVTRLVKIRAKNSRGNKRGGTRDFTVRVYRTTGGEELIEFTNATYEDFELRSGDAAVFSYVGPLIKIVQNLTVNKYLKIKVAKTGCYVATYVYGEASHEVALLRSFRDCNLMANRATRAIVEVYYATSPIAIKRFGNNCFFRMLCSGFLTLIINCVRYFERR